MKKQKTVTYDLADIARKLFAPPSANKLFVYNVAARGGNTAAARAPGSRTRSITPCSTVRAVPSISWS